MTFDRDSGIREALRKDERIFVPLPVNETRRRGEAPIPFSEAGEGAGGMFTVGIAAADASDSSKSAADFICAGANDEVVIQAAIDALDTELASNNSQGYRVLLSEGEFIVDVSAGSITLGNSGMTLQGMGKEATLLNAGSTVPTSNDEPLIDCGANRMTIRDLSVQGGATNRLTGIGVRGANDTRIENCLFSTNGYGIEAQDGQLVVTGCGFEGSRGLWLNTVTHGVVSDNYFGNSGNGVEVASSSRVIVSDNTFEQVGEHSISLSIVSDSLVADNLIYQPSSTTNNTYDGIYVEGDSNRNYIHGNTIIPKTAANQPRYGINVSAAACDDTRIGDNSYGVLTDYGTFPLNDAGTTTKYPTAVRAVMNVGGALADATTGASRYPIHEPSIFLDAYPTVDTAPSGSAAVFDVNKNATTMYGTATNPQVAAAANVGTIAPADATLLATGDVLTMDVDTASSAEDAVIIARLLVG